MKVKRRKKKRKHKINKMMETIKKIKHLQRGENWQIEKINKKNNLIQQIKISTILLNCPNNVIIQIFDRDLIIYWI